MAGIEFAGELGHYTPACLGGDPKNLALGEDAAAGVTATAAAAWLFVAGFDPAIRL